MRSRLYRIRWMLGIAALIALIPPAEYYLMTGVPFPLSHVDRLRHPVMVRSWSEKGLQLADGREVMPLGMRKLPLRSTALREVTKDGVEVAEDGRVFGRLRIWHWCGNDPLRNDVRRIDVAHLLTYFRQGVPVARLMARGPKPYSTEGGFSERGWNVSEYAGMKMAADPKFQAIFNNP